MIRITGENEQPLRMIQPDGEMNVEFHDRFGFVSSESLESRQELRKASGAYVPAAEPRFSFSFAEADGHFRLKSASGCRVEPDGERWKIHADSGIFFIEDLRKAPAVEAAAMVDEKHSRLPILLLILLMLLPVALMTWMTETKVETKIAENTVAPVVIQMQKPPPMKNPTAAPDPQAKRKKAITQQLGFLGLLGRKDLTKAVGGLPTPAKQVTAGAGPGGTEGSGGELLAGLGRGLHKTTVGNSGVAGLGGIGTKGAGGGAGGYGDTAYGGGAGGQTLSTMPMGQDAVIDEGLDRAQIQATIMRYLSQVRACYEEGLKRNQAMIGQVTMAFEVGGQGNLNYSKVQRSSLNDRPVEDCIQMKMMNWKFPQPRGGVNVKVSYPFMLRPMRS